MKHIITPLMLLALGTIANAQGTITITDEEGAPATNSSFTVTDAADVLTMGKAFTAVLNGSSDNISVRRYEMGVLSGTQNYFCWWECYAPTYAGVQPLWVSPDPVEMTDGVAWEGFHAYYRPWGIAGTSCFRYVWYSEAGVADSVWIDICFAATAVGINEVAASGARLDISPNPSSGEVTFQFDAMSNDRSQLVLHNALGERVSSMSINGAQRKITFGDGQLASGVWFASLESEGRPVATRRFVITGH